MNDSMEVFDDLHLFLITLHCNINYFCLSRKFEKEYHCYHVAIVTYLVFSHPTNSWWSHHGVVANILNCDIVVNEIELQSRYYVHFRTNILEEMHSLPYPIGCWLDCITTVLFEGWPLYLVPKKDWYAIKQKHPNTSNVFFLGEFFTPALTDGFSLEFEWH